jgi:hypothetical protein
MLNADQDANTTDAGATVNSNALNSIMAYSSVSLDQGILLIMVITNDKSTIVISLYL